jgi:hypothetical protein
MVHPSVLTLFYWPFLSGLAVNPQPAARSPQVPASFQTFHPRR